MTTDPRKPTSAEPLDDAALDGAAGGADALRRAPGPTGGITPDQRAIVGGFKKLSGLESEFEAW